MSKERHNVYAHTEPRNDFPGYISVNLEADRSVSFTVRSQGNNGNSVGTISLTEKQVATLVENLRFEVLGVKGSGG